MKITRVLLCISTAGIVLVLLVTAGTVLGQSPDDNLTIPAAEATEAVAPPDDETNSHEQVEERSETEFVLAQPPYTMNYQGYLTDSGGSPLNGIYDLGVFQMG